MSCCLEMGQSVSKWFCRETCLRRKQTKSAKGGSQEKQRVADSLFVDVQVECLSSAHFCIQSAMRTISLVSGDYLSFVNRIYLHKHDYWSILKEGSTCSYFYCGCPPRISVVTLNFFWLINMKARSPFILRENKGSLHWFFFF